MEKKLLPEEIVQIRMDLTNKASAVRRRAVKNIRKYNLVELGEELYLAYLHERKDKRTWETQMEMINALGKIRYTAVLPYLEEIIEKNKRLDAITSSAALAYIRITWQSNNDIKPVLYLLKHGNLSVINGVMAGLAYDKMIPSKEEQELLINLFDNMPFIKNQVVSEKQWVEYSKRYSSRYKIEFANQDVNIVDIETEYYNGELYHLYPLNDSLYHDRANPKRIYIGWKHDGNRFDAFIQFDKKYMFDNMDKLSETPNSRMDFIFNVNRNYNMIDCYLSNQTDIIELPDEYRKIRILRIGR